jgi:hypothetical protein
MNTYKLARRPSGEYQLIMVDAFGIEHPQETLFEEERVEEDDKPEVG